MLGLQAQVRRQPQTGVDRHNVAVREPPARLGTRVARDSSIFPALLISAEVSTESFDKILNSLAELALQQLFDFWPALARYIAVCQAD
jgi:hypothetical protein